ncbi:MAG TPA: type III pantothenate kinase [Xanthomonadaceae bacterium]|nr:type III pantothenate kinase [Xanthomonadaceae bacterium]
MSAWLFDLGNTRLKCTPLRDAGRGEATRVAHDGHGLPERWDAGLPAQVDEAVLASVAAPALTAQLLEALAARCARISVARTTRAFAGVRIAYAEPRRLGVDRFLALLAARARGAHAWLVVGVGTALTIDLLDRDGLHLGGRIAPSPTLMREALHARAAQLPATGGAYAEFAADTGDALASGCEGAALALVERSLAQAASALPGAPPTLLLHGGGAQALRARLPASAFAPDLVLEGLACWARASGSAA